MVASGGLLLIVGFLPLRGIHGAEKQLRTISLELSKIPHLEAFFLADNGKSDIIILE